MHVHGVPVRYEYFFCDGCLSTQEFVGLNDDPERVLRCQRCGHEVVGKPVTAPLPTLSPERRGEETTAREAKP